MVNKDYKLRELTPKSMVCGIGACPAIYYLFERFPERMNTSFGDSPYSPKGDRESYLIIGKVVSSDFFGLEGRIGEGEVLIKVPKELIDGMERK